MKKILICGMGYVGSAVYDYFANHYETKFYDPKFSELALKKPEIKDKLEQQGMVGTYCDADLTVVCVPTQPGKDGECDTTIVEDTVKKVPGKLILIKSTIPPGTVEKLKKETGKRIVFSPEYIGEGKYFVPFWKYPDPHNMKLHAFQILGGDPKDTDAVVDIMLPVGGPDVEFCQTDETTAQFVKYAENLWGATKVTWANEMYDAAKAFGISWNKARQLLLKDTRIEPMHTAVFKDKRGFGGKCFPKDLMAFIKACEAEGFEPKLLKMVWNRNQEFIKLNEKKTDVLDGQKGKKDI